MPHPTKVVGARVGAFIIDNLLLAAITFGLYLALTKSFPKEGYHNGIVLGHTRHAFESGSSNRTVWIVLVLVATLAIFVIAPGLTGRSPGKAATGIRIVNKEGADPGVPRALVRWLVWVVDDFPYILPGVTGFVVALTTRGNQRVGDMAAGTWVVRNEAAGRPIEQLLAQTAPAAVAPGAGWQQSGGWQQPTPPGPAPPAPAPAQPAGWYADPSGQTRLRYWDGSAWTEHTSA